MFPTYGTLIIVIIYRISIISHMKKTNMVSERDWAISLMGRPRKMGQSMPARGQLVVQ
jgi:hypothetical protein